MDRIDKIFQDLQDFFFVMTFLAELQSLSIHLDCHGILLPLFEKTGSQTIVN